MNLHTPVCVRWICACACVRVGMCFVLYKQGKNIFKGHLCQHTDTHGNYISRQQTVNMQYDSDTRMDERLFSARSLETMRYFSVQDALAITEQVLVRFNTPGCKSVSEYGDNVDIDSTAPFLARATTMLRTFLNKPAAIRFSYMQIPAKDSDLLVSEFRSIIELVFKHAIVHVYKTQNIQTSGQYTKLQTFGYIVDEMDRLFQSHHYIFRTSGEDIMQARRDGLDW